MYNRGRNSCLHSDAQSKEKLAIYVYEYLMHIGAQKAAQTFLQEIHWDKNISIGESPGFLHLWWSIFWDIYSAAPERRELFEHSHEARAFHDYGFMSHSNHPINRPGMVGDPFRPQCFVPMQSRFPANPLGGHPPPGFAPMMRGGGGPPPPYAMRGGYVHPQHNRMYNTPGPGLGPPGPPLPPQQQQQQLPLPPQSSSSSSHPPHPQATMMFLPQQGSLASPPHHCNYPVSAGTNAGSLIPASPHDSGVSSQGGLPDVYGTPRRPGVPTVTMHHHQMHQPPMVQQGGILNQGGSGPDGGGCISDGNGNNNIMVSTPTGGPPPPHHHHHHPPLSSSSSTTMNVPTNCNVSAGVLEGPFFDLPSCDDLGVECNDFTGSISQLDFITPSSSSHQPPMMQSQSSSFMLDNSPSSSDINFTNEHNDSLAIQKLKESMQEDVRIFEGLNYFSSQ